MKKNDKKEELTFAELKQKVDHIERATHLPTAKALQNGKSPVIASKTMTDGSLLQVFENGYVLYKTSRFYTVFSVSQCGDYTYHSRTGPLCFSADYFDDKPWALRLQLEAENRIVHNQNTYEWNEYRSKYRFMPWAVEKNCAMDFQEEVNLWDEAEERLAVLSNKQRKIFLLYFYEGYTQAEIAKMLGVTSQAITQILATAKKKIQKNTK